MATISFKGQTSFNLLPEEISKRFTDNISFKSTSSAVKWVYRSAVSVDYDTDAVFTDNDQFIEFDSNNPSELDASADLVYWIYIKHTGYTDTDKSIATTDRGVMFTFTDTTPVYNTQTGAATSILLAPGDVIIMRLPYVAADNLKFRTCNFSSNNMQSAASSGETVCLEIAAAIKDV
tara:strand:- start:463 stop:993 length:531 start_codon:yes stop_codon:yes gene_type:complete